MAGIDLTEKLIAGDVIYDYINNRRVTVVKVDPAIPMSIVVRGMAGRSKPVQYNRFGSILVDGVDCFLFPSKDTRDWNKFVRTITHKHGDIVISKNENGEEKVSIFSHSDGDSIYVYEVTETGIEPIEVAEVTSIPSSCDALFYKHISNKPGRHLLMKQEQKPFEIKELNT